MVKLFLVVGALSFIPFFPVLSMDIQEDTRCSSHAKQQQSSSTSTQEEYTTVRIQRYKRAIKIYKKDQKQGLRDLRKLADEGYDHALNVLRALGYGLSIDNIPSVP